MAWIETTLVGLLVVAAALTCLLRLLRSLGLAGAGKGQACGGCSKGCGCSIAPVRSATPTEPRLAVTPPAAASRG